MAGVYDGRGGPVHDRNRKFRYSCRPAAYRRRFESGPGSSVLGDGRNGPHHQRSAPANGPVVRRHGPQTGLYCWIARDGVRCDRERHIPEPSDTTHRSGYRGVRRGDGNDRCDRDHYLGVPCQRARQSARHEHVRHRARRR